jgi:NAD(P)-dependent dehydrogenase (short-subunit alcohol dehydrogenase family)
MPGLTRTDTNTEITDAHGDHFSALTPIGRLLDAAEVAGPVVYLGSAANTGITRQVIPVTGSTAVLVQGRLFGTRCGYG